MFDELTPSGKSGDCFGALPASTLIIAPMKKSNVSKTALNDNVSNAMTEIKAIASSRPIQAAPGRVSSLSL